MAVTHHDGIQTVPGEHAAGRARDYVRRHWKYAGSASPGDCCTPASDAPAGPGLFQRLQNYSLCISGMAFQDAWNLDLERLHRCCVHVADSKGGLIPFCAYYITDSCGRRLM